MVSWLGFSQVAVPYRRAARAAGTTKFPLFKMFRFAADGIVSFSISPLRLAMWTGFAASGLAILAILSPCLSGCTHGVPVYGVTKVDARKRRGVHKG